MKAPRFTLLSTVQALGYWRDTCDRTGHSPASLSDYAAPVLCTSMTLMMVLCGVQAARPRRRGQPPEEKSVLQALQDLGSHFGREGSFGTAAAAAAAAPTADAGSDADPPRPRIGKVRGFRLMLSRAACALDEGMECNRSPPWCAKHWYACQM